MDNDGCTSCVIDPLYSCEEVVGVSQCELTCGNGSLDSGEECDDDNYVDNDGCTSCSVDSSYVCE